MIVALDKDRQSNEKLGSMLKQTMINHKYRYFTSISECIDFVSNFEVSLVFLSKDIGHHPYDVQIVCHKLRKIKSDIDIILMGNDDKLSSSMALWSLKNRCSGYLCKPLEYEKLVSSLRNIWFNPILELDDLISF